MSKHNRGNEVTKTHGNCVCARNERGNGNNGKDRFNQTVCSCAQNSEPHQEREYDRDDQDRDELEESEEPEETSKTNK